jgi:hypothetical protein
MKGWRDSKMDPILRRGRKINGGRKEEVEN